MWALISAACLLLSAVSAQHNNGQYDHQRYGAPSYQSNTVPHSPSGHHSSAPVHYVSIGQQLQGDYKFGYESGNGAFREETRLPDGTVMGQYGYVDASGQKRVIKYRAGKEGFVAEGDGIEKPAPAQAPAPQAAPSYNSYSQPQAPAHNYNHYNPQPAQHNYNPQPAQHNYNPQPAQYNPQQYSAPQQHSNQYNIQAPQQQYNGYPFTYITHENSPQSPLYNNRQQNQQYQG